MSRIEAIVNGCKRPYESALAVCNQGKYKKKVFDNYLLEKLPTKRRIIDLLDYFCVAFQRGGFVEMGDNFGVRYWNWLFESSVPDLLTSGVKTQVGPYYFEGADPFTSTKMGLYSDRLIAGKVSNNATINSIMFDEPILAFPGYYMVGTSTNVFFADIVDSNSLIRTAQYYLWKNESQLDLLFEEGGCKLVYCISDSSESLAQLTLNTACLLPTPIKYFFNPVRFCSYYTENSHILLADVYDLVREQDILFDIQAIPQVGETTANITTTEKKVQPAMDIDLVLDPGVTLGGNLQRIYYALTFSSPDSQYVYRVQYQFKYGVPTTPRSSDFDYNKLCPIMLVVTLNKYAKTDLNTIVESFNLSKDLGTGITSDNVTLMDDLDYELLQTHSWDHYVQDIIGSFVTWVEPIGDASLPIDVISDIGSNKWQYRKELIIAIYNEHYDGNYAAFFPEAGHVLIGENKDGTFTEYPVLIGSYVTKTSKPSTGPHVLWGRHYYSNEPCHMLATKDETLNTEYYEKIDLLDCAKIIVQDATKSNLNIMPDLVSGSLIGSTIISNKDCRLRDTPIPEYSSAFKGSISDGEIIAAAIEPNVNIQPFYGYSKISLKKLISGDTFTNVLNCSITPYHPVLIDHITIDTVIGEETTISGTFYAIPGNSYIEKPQWLSDGIYYSWLVFNDCTFEDMVTQDGEPDKKKFVDGLFCETILNQIHSNGLPIARGVAPNSVWLLNNSGRINIFS